MAGLLDKFAAAFEQYNAGFRDFSRPVADALGLESLVSHFDVFVYSFLLFNFANILLVPGLSRLFFGRIYGALNTRIRQKWYANFPPLSSIQLSDFSVPPDLGIIREDV